MAEQAVTVPTDQVITLNVALNSGATIYNSDSENAIWVSTNPGLTPGVGMRIGPKGSLEWSADGAGCYAIIDTGVQTPVSITISNNVSQLVNPVDIGVAVAAQLLATGVPSIILTEKIPVDNVFQMIDVRGYASLSITYQINSPGNVANGYQFFADKGGVTLLGEQVFSSLNNFFITYTVNVIGPYLRFVGSIKNLTIYGANRAVNERIYGDSCYIQTPNRAWPSTRTPMEGGFTTNGGAHMLRLTTTGNAVGNLHVGASTGFNTYDYYTIATTLEGYTDPTNTVINNVTKTVILPRGQLTFAWHGKTAGTYQVIVNVFPSP